MRRALSIILVLFFGIGPLSPLLEAGEAVRLPSCCRRLGPHHCAETILAAPGMAFNDSGKHAFTAPATCPAFPNDAPATTSSGKALTPTLASAPALHQRPHSPQSARAAASLGKVDTRAGRGPPSKPIA